MADSSKVLEQDRHVTQRLKRRAVVRVQCEEPLVVAARDSVIFFEGGILDLSVNGIRIRVHRKLQAGKTIAILLKKYGVCQSEHVAKVIHVHPENTDSWLVGCEFDESLSPEQLREFMSE